MSRSLSDEERRGLRLLEFDALLDEVAARCSLDRAAARVRASLPLTDPAELDSLWDWVDELSALLEDGDDLPLGGMLDLEAALGEEREIPGPLDGEALAATGAACRELSKVLVMCRNWGERIPKSANSLGDCEDPGALGAHIGSALEPDGRIKDDASPKLAGLRRSARAAETKLRDAAQVHMRRAVDQGWTSAGELVMRGDRFCIPLKSGRRGQLRGVIHDRSATGGTLFVEPLEVVESSNLLQEARLAVAEEEHRILVQINRALADRVPSLLELYGRIVHLDALRARARWGRSRDGRRPALAPGADAPLRLRGIRHPLLQTELEKRERVEELVALDLELAPDDRVLLISGPNAGGKTVALKALGLASLMAQCAIPIPCLDTPHLPIFARVLLELGDEQSIADALSHFSAHVTHLQAILDESDESSLVLLDEIGGGTDPTEGVALARSYLEELARRCSFVFATTHYGQLKALVHESPGFRNASMAFDGEALRPLFRLMLDTPGASRALEIADRVGLDAGVLERARSLVGDESLRLDRVLLDLESQRAATAQAREEAERERDDLRTNRRRYEELARDLKTNRRQRLDAAEREAEGIVRQARARIERLLSRIQETGGDAREIAQVARETVDHMAERLQQRQEERHTPTRGHRPARLEPGATVRHAALGLVGTIVDIQGERITLDCGGRRLVARADELVDPGAGESAPPPPAQGGVVLEPSLAAESPGGVSRVDVRGRDVEDAWILVDKALDRCLLAGTGVLEVVHGKGTGRLRAAIGEHLGRDARVQESKLGDGRHGDDGLTIVQLR